ncbi:hypothetical protein KSP40_PGU008602 [Platanthera guangdongensis]|uniref:Uncharacterized protein n=1 Tax=Platanthera guangdongensis TaxID=2320717 RepID=A0ABR2MBY3_9ASPA
MKRWFSNGNFSIQKTLSQWRKSGVRKHLTNPLTKRSIKNIFCCFRTANLVMLSLDKEIPLEKVKQDDSDLELPNVLFNDNDEEEDGVQMKLEFIDPQIEV